jgi:hypothetical protein
MMRCLVHGLEVGLDVLFADENQEGSDVGYELCPDVGGAGEGVGHVWGDH